MTPIHRILIANRGEIALRIIRTAQKLNIETVLACSSADVDSLPARLADQCIVLGPPPSSESYLNVDKVVAAATQSKVDAIHPGYGFLSENSNLARNAAKAGIRFIGPTPEQLDAIGDKLQARANAVAANLPCVPGGKVSSLQEAQALLSQIGLPILIKAVGGGGGRGMKLVRNEAELAQQLVLAQAEAEAAFGDPRVYLERFIESGRHVEVQVLGDGRDVVHLGTRDCSVQRRYQKVIEEAPAPSLSDILREGLHEAAVRFAQHLSYKGAGTVEFLVDKERETFYFLEMNARIQVEHPVTEEIYSVDLVAEQIRIAEGRSLRFSQNELICHGHAIECRLNAEDPYNDFQPSPGTLQKFALFSAPDVRIDTHLFVGAQITPFYDSLMAKLIVSAENREKALLLMQQLLNNSLISGVTTNLALHQALFEDPVFLAGGIDTRYLGKYLANSKFEKQ
jgi:acetyl-CoA carboxylase biotin carboxylase subunit